MVDLDAALGEELLEIPVGEVVAKVPPDGEGDEVGRKPEAPKGGGAGEGSGHDAQPYPSEAFPPLAAPPTQQTRVELSAIDGIPFDLRGAELGHRRGRCTFDALIEKYELADEGLRRMAVIIRGADLPHEETIPSEAPGVLAVFTGVRDSCTTDEERLERGSVVCEALYAYCSQTSEAGLRL